MADDKGRSRLSMVKRQRIIHSTFTRYSSILRSTLLAFLITIINRYSSTTAVIAFYSPWKLRRDYNTKATVKNGKTKNILINTLGPIQRKLTPKSIELPSLSTSPTRLLLSSSSSNTVIENDSTLVSQTFTELYSSHLPAWLLERCHDCGWTYPTKIQQQALNAILGIKNNNSNNISPTINDVVVQAETGSGKTLAYLLPALASIDASRSAVQAMIVVPTRELGLQVARIAKRLAVAYNNDKINKSNDKSNIIDNDKSNNYDNHDEVIGFGNTGNDKDDDTTNDDDNSKTVINVNNNNHKLLVMSVLQGSANRRQRAWAWADPPHLVIGTPVELSNMIKFGGIKRCNSIQYLVVDEVDACLLNNAGSYNLQSSPLHELLSKYLSPTFTEASSVSLDENDALQQAVAATAAASSKASNRPLSEKRQTVFASATLPQHRHFIKQCVQNQWMLREPVHVSSRSGEQLLPSTLDHAYVVCRDNGQKLPALVRVLRKLMSSGNNSNHTSATVSKKVLVFAETQRSLEDMALVLSQQLDDCVVWRESFDKEMEASIVLSVLNFEDSLSKRAAAVDAFRGDGYTFGNSNTVNGRLRKAKPSNLQSSDDESQQQELQYQQQSTQRKVPKLRILLSTDLAARGLDVIDTTHVLHYDLPINADTYVHRSGRTGRLGRSGQVISLITSDEEFVLQRLANKLSIDIVCISRQQQQQQSSERRKQQKSTTNF